MNLNLLVIMSVKIACHRTFCIFFFILYVSIVIIERIFPSVLTKSYYGGILVGKIHRNLPIKYFFRCVCLYISISSSDLTKIVSKWSRTLNFFATKKHILLNSLEVLAGGIYKSEGKINEQKKKKNIVKWWRLCLECEKHRII